jgi:hypothetical protein
VERTLEVNVEHRVEVARRQVEERYLADDASVVDEEVEQCVVATEAIAGAGDDRHSTVESKLCHDYSQATGSSWTP